MNYLDYAILSILVIYALWGLSKGFMKIVLDFLGYVVAYFSAKLFGPILMNYLEQTSFKLTIENRVLDTMNTLSPGISKSFPDVTIPNNMTTLLTREPALDKIFETYPKLFNKIEGNLNLLAGKNFLDVLTDYMLLIISVVIIFISVKILFTIIVSIIMSNQDNMPLSITNRILGTAFGLGLGFILLSFSLQMIESFALTSTNILVDAITESRFGHIFTGIPLIEWLSKIV